MSLLVHGIEIGADSAEILRAVECAKAAGDFLLHLGHSDGALAEIVGKRTIGDRPRLFARQRRLNVHAPPIGKFPR